MNERTLGAHLEQFTPKQRKFLCWVMNVSEIMGHDIHLGMLPFIKADTALLALARTTQGRNTAEVTAKIKQLYNIGEHVQWHMFLNNAKVGRRFGAHPERGHKIHLAPKKQVTVGVKWSLPKKDYVPDKDVLVVPHVVLLNVGGCEWHVTCERRYMKAVQSYLLDYCM